MDNYTKKRESECGAIVVEATISLTAFIFAIFTILSVVNICYIQARINMALNSAAKDISQYSYMYYMLGLDELQAGWYEDVSDETKLAKETVDGMAGLVGTLHNAESNVQSGDFDALYSDLQANKDSISGLAKQYADKIGDDPKQFILGMAKMAGGEFAEEMKVLLAQVLGEAFMKKNLVADTSDTPDAYLKRYNVVDGIDGLDFNYSTLMAYGTTDKIQLVVTYEVEVVKLLNIDFTFTIRQCSQTIAWGNGVSQVKETVTELPEGKSTVWDLEDTTARGHYIIEQEKNKYEYTRAGRGHGFDAYNNKDGVNEFISIVTINTHEPTYQDKSKFKGRVSSAYKSLKSGVSALDENVTVTGKDGKDTTVLSKKDTRTYTVIVAVPDDADESVKNEIKSSLEESFSDLTVLFVDGYGVPTPPKDVEAETTDDTE